MVSAAKLKQHEDWLKKMGVKVGICGQGPSDFPDFAQFLVKEGIDTISVTPDSLLKTLKALSQQEEEKTEFSVY